MIDSSSTFCLHAGCTVALTYYYFAHWNLAFFALIHDSLHVRMVTQLITQFLGIE